MSDVARIIHVISDLHLGGIYPESSGTTDRGFRICTNVDVLAGFVDALAAKPAASPRIELVINGDMVDFLAERHATHPHWRPFVADQATAVEKLSAILERDRAFFDALGRFLDRGHRLVILLGNHDLELCLPLVRRRLERALGVKGSHDFQFIYDGEAYVVGDVLIEHGNRYDKFNVVDYDALRRVRSLLSRKQMVPDKYRFEPPAGSHMVAEVINPIKEQYKFVDLLKPETEAVIPLLLALEPGYRKLIAPAVKNAMLASRHGLETPVLPQFGGDIHAEPSSVGNDFGGDISSFDSAPTRSRGDAADTALRDCLDEVLGGGSAEFLRDIEAGSSAHAEFTSAGIGDDISTAETISRTLGIAKLLFSRSDGNVERRLPSLLKAMRCLQTGNSFATDVEHLTEYRQAAEGLVGDEVRYVVFGHTHYPRDVKLTGGGRYFNSGTWADVFRFPKEVVSGTEAEALARLREFVGLMEKGDFTSWALFRPTFVRLELDQSDRVIESELCAYTGPQGV